MQTPTLAEFLTAVVGPAVLLLLQLLAAKFGLPLVPKAPAPAPVPEPAPVVPAPVVPAQRPLLNLVLTKILPMLAPLLPLIMEQQARGELPPEDAAALDALRRLLEPKK